MGRYKIELDYIGTAYSGWQVQPERRTVQGQLQNALKQLTSEDVAVIGSGRTDAGVHALMQTAHFDLQREMETQKLYGGLNHYLDGDVRIIKVERVGDNFHARYDCKEKTYLYLMYREPKRAALSDRAWAVDRDICVSQMGEAAQLLLGTHDFAAFMASGSGVQTTVRTIKSVSLEERDGLIRFEITADGFLYNMVRIIVRLLESVGCGRSRIDEVTEIIESKQRERVKGLAPAHGLYLKSQRY